jgi:hypothetical protein
MNQIKRKEKGGKGRETKRRKYPYYSDGKDSFNAILLCGTGICDRGFSLPSGFIGLLVLILDFELRRMGKREEKEDRS